jgi:hypothetical protein
LALTVGNNTTPGMVLENYPSHNVAPAKQQHFIYVS